MRGWISGALLALPGAWLGTASRPAHADESNQPYIDQLKSKMKDTDQGTPENPDVPDAYIQSLKRKMKPSVEEQNGSSQPYIDRLKEKEPEHFKEEDGPGSSYTEQEKEKLGPSNEESAITAVNEGRSGLKMKRPGEIKYAIGFKLGTYVSRTVLISNQPQVASFSSLYGGKFVPDLTLFGEYQLFHSEKGGSLGLIASGGFQFFSGFGNFQIPLFQPDGTPFPTTSNTQFRFYTIPVSAGVNYRFNLFNYIRPFVQLSPTLVPYFESRSDNVVGGAHQGLTEALTFAAGASILADFISKNTAWDLYTDAGIKHSYFTVQYTRLISVIGDANFTFSGVDAGVLFEF